MGFAIIYIYICVCFIQKKSLATEDFVLIVRAGYFVHDSFGVGCVARFLFISTIIFFFFFGAK